MRATGFTAMGILGNQRAVEKFRLVEVMTARVRTDGEDLAFCVQMHSPDWGSGIARKVV